MALHFNNGVNQRLEHFIGVVGFSFSEAFTNSISHRPKTKTRFSHCSTSITTTTVCSSAAKTDSTVSDVVEYQDVQDHTNGVSTTHTSAGAWLKVARNVSGEWDGFGADFSKEGNPIELPESVVPEAYREWEVKVFDWQTQCPTLAQPEEPVLVYKLIKLLPTVGCEADAATRYSIDRQDHPRLSGCYSCYFCPNS